VLLAARLIYEQTYLTWSEGPQIVGFSLVHLYGGLFILGLLSVLTCLIAFVSGLAFAAWKRAKITILDWALAGAAHSVHILDHGAVRDVADTDH
jgi:hypothetical protein